ncbi:MAG: periplasmic binding protein [Bacteroidetes bacterium]|nr:periplasmic binding protein [Bacteroidota bacterium]
MWDNPQSIAISGEPRIIFHAVLSFSTAISMQHKLLNIFLFVILFFGSCAPKQEQQNTSKPLESVKISYARGFSVNEYENYKKVVVYSPWKKGEIYALYYLVKDEKVNTPNDGYKIKVPLKTLATTSVTHLEFLSLLKEIQTITGVCSPNLIYNSEIQKNVQVGKISDLGDAFNLNVEKVMLLKPAALMTSGFNQTDANAQRIQQAGIPVIYNNEWMETSLLGRAEWIKFVAAFFGKETVADTIFAGIEKRYNKLKSRVADVPDKPKIVSGNNFRGTWYMPAGSSFMGNLFKDAGAAYYYANDTTTGSLPLNVETVLQNFSDTDVWLNANFNTISELIKSDSKHALFRPVTNEQVYNFNKRLLPSSANDFWESAVARPDLLLADVIAILHPDLLPGYELVYAEKLK